MRLVQIASYVIHQYAMLPMRATLKLNVAHAGNIEGLTLNSSQIFCLNDFCFNFLVIILKYNKTNSD